MSKKRAKSGAGSAGVSRWESGLLSTNFEEEGWKACISFLIGNKLDDKEYASILSSAVDSRLRRLFTVIHKDTLMEEVNELGNSKTKKGKDAPQFFEICETVKSEYLDKGEEIPQGLMAKLLKWKLLAIKEKDLKRREEEKKALENKDVKGGKGAKEAAGGKRARSKSPAKGKGKKSPEVPSPKKDSKLKKRGEEDDDNKYIDDEPDDGPQHYVIIEGFEQAPLLSLLTDLGINVNCIIRLLAEDYSLFEKRRKEEEEEMDEDDRPLEGKVVVVMIKMVELVEALVVVHIDDDDERKSKTCIYLKSELEYYMITLTQGWVGVNVMYCVFVFGKNQVKSTRVLSISASVAVNVLIQK
eukprot:XP_799985.4 PREDICTED: sperm-associated antigen 17 [Strongylocentrotus purpuratus]